jgi:hypothetical protein
MTNSCESHGYGASFGYAILYFLIIFIVLTLLNVLGLFNSIVEKIETDCYDNWLKEEEKDDNKKETSLKKTITQWIKRNVVNYKLEKMGDVEGQKKTGYLQKLAQGESYYCGSNGTYFKNGITIHPWKIFCMCCCNCCDCCAIRIPCGLLEDALFYIMNNHGLISTFCASNDHPYTRNERNFAFFALGCLTYFGVSVVSSFNFNSVESNSWDILCIGFLNFFLTNSFQILFACSCLFSSSKKSETKVRKVFRESLEVLGSITGMFLSLSVGLLFLLLAAAICMNGSSGMYICN